MTWDKTVKILSALAGAIGGLFGGWDTMLQVLAICIAIDYLTGVMVAWAKKSPKSETGGVSSQAGFAGLAKKAVILLVILLAAVLDKVIGNAVFRDMAVCYYIANEGISILENAVLLDVPVPAGLKNALEIMRKKNDEGKQEETDPPDEAEKISTD